MIHYVDQNVQAGRQLQAAEGGLQWDPGGVDAEMNDARTTVDCFACDWVVIMVI